jgi:cytochrome c
MKPVRSAPMRLVSPILLGALALAACGKAPNPASAPASAPPAAAVPTSVEVKAALATLPTAYQGADLENGEAKFALCRACHTVIQGGENMTGPNLWGVFGRKAGSVAGYNYSDGVKALPFAWDAERINQWIANPRAMVPTTKMTYLGMEDPKDRIDVVAYLKVASSRPN